jgi:hypothetical protein
LEVVLSNVQDEFEIAEIKILRRIFDPRNLLPVAAASVSEDSLGHA